jgi:hypothetical protein
MEVAIIATLATLGPVAFSVKQRQPKQTWSSFYFLIHESKENSIGTLVPMPLLLCTCSTLLICTFIPPPDQEKQSQPTKSCPTEGPLFLITVLVNTKRFRPLSEAPRDQ